MSHDIKAAMTDGFTTTGRLGLGLSGIKRLSNEFSIESAPGKGTTVHPMQSQVKGTGLVWPAISGQLSATRFCSLSSA